MTMTMKPTEASERKNQLSPKERELAAAIAAGMTEVEAGEKVGVSRSTVQRAGRKSEFRRFVFELRSQAASAACGELLAGARVAARELVRLSKQAKRGDVPRIAACRAVLKLSIESF